MSDSFNLPLRPLIDKRDRPDSLPVEIAQINAQYGSFRDVNEASLRAKIQEEKEKDGVLDEDEDDKSTADLDTTERQELLYKRRAEITQFALQAHMETMFALDFVSLLISKNAPRQAETSMSAYLKSVAPLGSLNAEVVNPPPKPESSEGDTKTVSRGWRLQNFDAAANKLLNSATRLEAEVASETRYWNEVLAVKDKGWKVCRLPREQQSLGVQYGFLEATPLFRDRGLASLRRADDGSLILDKGLIPPKARTVRVRVKESGRFTGCSKLQNPVLNGEDSIESRILQARDTVYEEELFHELVREARVIAKQGVTTRQNLIQFAVSDEQEIMLDLVDVNQDSANDEQESHEQDVLADALAYSIRILLAYAHRQNLRRRTQVPPPLTPVRRHALEYQLLRPIMAYLQHSSQVRWLESFVKDIYRVLKSAGITCDYTSSLFSSVNLARKKGLPQVEALVEGFLVPLESTLSANLVTPQSSFNVKIRTNLSPPASGTQFDVSVNLPRHPDTQPPARIGLRDEAAAVITHFVMLDVVSAISSSHPKPSPGAGESATWEAAYPHHGELLTLSPKTGKQKKMKVMLSRHEMTIQVYEMRGIERLGRSATDKEPSLQSRTWKSDPVVPAQSSLMDFVAEVSKE
ncbi:hypothetical protein ASPWEDRAFT_172880 [Aspergillus wentii DTO 134E9]|uniref:Mediator of RNA polymerase II transcription subunit 17 n=1 Tax=Aspergillus wentii DTO 134E9 TaxID=1073089 RepID=A0A1L9RMI2_ASPWE|nr:uncharacterized protein ASPWEDRAFT_172880 [Aspergillus wentii DTO 134E9]KAI9929466.1 RNA polymerase II mediator complex subunit [Aspergillus wentii]OJJ36093.1 hypothetical protein ASPWEDRAFT_172880 [Aspergillus wentii DTO 134E9]